MRSWKIPLIWINLTSRTMNDSFWTQCRHVQSTDLLWKDLLLGCKNVSLILEISWLMNYSPNSYRLNWSVSDFERRPVSDFLKKLIIYQIPIYRLYFINNEYVKFSQSHDPIVGCNPTIGCTSNSWMQKHPLVGCSYIPMPTVAIRVHLKVAPYCESIVDENSFQMTPWSKNSDKVKILAMWELILS